MTEHRRPDVPSRDRVPQTTGGVRPSAAEEIAALNLLGQSASFQDVMRRIAKIARADAPVLIEGETGSGKELAARAIHYLGVRCHKPFIPLNCGAIPDTLVEAELFGHERGAFTDAREARPGVVAQAHGGTLFLDEIDTLSAKGQVALLRFLQDMRYRPLGQSAEVTGNVRIMAASNRSLHALAREGAFRRDLLYRLDILALAIPALRDRLGDAELLARYFLRKFAAKYDLPVRHLHADTLGWICSYEWPGNVRELENFVHRQVLLAEGEEIRYSGGDRARDQESVGGNACPDFTTAKARAIADFERTYVARVLAEAQGNVTAAARIAGKERRAFGRLVKKHAIDRTRYRG